MGKHFARRACQILEKKGEGIHHIAFAGDALQETLSEINNNGVKLIDEHPRQGAEGLKKAFLHPKSTHGVLTELCEDPKEMVPPSLV